MTTLCYKDTVTFVKVTPTGYANSKTVISQIEVPGTFLQNTGFLHSSNQDAIESDAVYYPDPSNAFVKANNNRLESMYIIAPLFEGDPDESWYRVLDVSVNRDHLLSNNIDNIQLLLKKTRPIPGVS